ncbi:LysR family transcriptional regulator [Budvicia aquatica]|uniref:Cyn operon transcriptional activator n=1 Tax=Budvicia aquatica TaxID=82979 RepID=A0A484ZLL3_9GAMM|nr:LysR family transcriptional regulator [Budvicia aquatica]VFS48676.1 Cyn operon transcriptional activator [Budvicia aquatica]
MQHSHHVELIWLEDCRALAETLNFSRAAQRRNVTQPAFSRRIQALEQWTGTPLFERNRREVKLTKAGEVFNQQAIKLLRMIGTMHQTTLEAAGVSSPMLIFAATHCLSSTFFPGWIRKSQVEHVYETLKLVSDTLSACERMFLHGDAQFLLCHCHQNTLDHLTPGQFTSLKVGQDELIPLCVSTGDGVTPKWQLARQTKDVPLLCYSNDSGLGRIINHCPKVADAVREMKKVFTSDLATSLLAMVRAGDGVAWLPRSLAESDLMNGTLVNAGSEARDFSVPIEIRLFRPATPLPAAAEKLWHSLKRYRLKPG